MAQQKVNCENEKCKKVFALHVKIGPETDGLYEVYFICPFCNKKYHCYYENRQSMSIQEQINELNSQLQNIRIIKKGIDFAKEYNKRNYSLKKIKKLKKDKKKILEKINQKNKLFNS